MQCLVREHLLTSLSGGQTGFLVFTNLLVFFAFFLDVFDGFHYRAAARAAG